MIRLSLPVFSKIRWIPICQENYELKLVPALLLTFEAGSVGNDESLARNENFFLYERVEFYYAFLRNFHEVSG